MRIACIKEECPSDKLVTLLQAFVELPMATVRKSVKDQLPGDWYPTSYLM